MADQGGNILIRDYRKGNWTVSETMVLIEAKRMDDERRMKRSSDSEGRSKPAELRWKWVEDYCWRKGCLRSQNQCNDKWDNLMRDYKKVRDYEKRIAEGRDGNEALSYWKLEKNERKEKNVPSNMLLQVYEALVEAVERRGTQKMVTTAAGGSGSNPNISCVVERPTVHPHPLPPLLQHQVSVSIPVLPPPPPAAPQAQPPLSLPYSQPSLPAVDSDTSEHSGLPAKRRRRRGGSGGGGGESSGGGASGSTPHEVGTAISRSASIIAEAIQACEERKERRHRDLLSLHERRLKIEQSMTELNRQGINGLVDAINNLANSILALASHKNQSTPK
ncbi:hypothetical protein P3X46_020088 [Hevea brasiliensis]|uniref:Myb-like domain-containing protein n=1 Tax=Hevea brasiliensis TaxID=3981 RepID=A0ABQ9LKT9_HEVBR|nr:uncharacterized protein LOC110672083 isoform X2 [Hevea brasiliensis]KAJ9168586.1 hypothetical protein P3X46_020088 [Hevea brasiliensis]